MVTERGVSEWSSEWHSERLSTNLQGSTIGYLDLDSHRLGTETGVASGTLDGPEVALGEGGRGAHAGASIQSVTATSQCFYPITCILSTTRYIMLSVPSLAYGHGRPNILYNAPRKAH